ncbi:hypothetical protein [Pseudomonas gingeri]|nr:hypothetical protein [Pseudomonas gingeri]
MQGPRFGDVQGFVGAHQLLERPLGDLQYRVVMLQQLAATAFGLAQQLQQ